MADSKTAAAPPDHETGVADASRVQPEPAAKSEARPTADPPKEDEVSKPARPAEGTDKPADKPASEQAKPSGGDDDDDRDVDMQDAAEAVTAVETPPPNKAKDRRKSTGEGKGKTLNKKASKVRMTHADAKPGDHFLVKLKGFPAWPAIICDETMLPEALISSRPITAARPDGTWAEPYADGAKRVNDRTFPVMYLSTNEFGWVSNTALTELDPETARSSITDKVRKRVHLKAAFELAAEQHPVEYYKEMLQQILAELVAQQEAEEEAADTPKKPKKGKAKADEVDAADSDGATKSKSKKRKAEDAGSTPQRSDSVKKPKIKLNTSTPKGSNGAPKGKDASVSKEAKSKTKLSKEGGDKKSAAAKETKMTPEERHARKEKEALFLRHKLQRGLLTRDHQPQESEMQQLSEFVTILENMADLEVSIIRKTKINKVLKGILKLEAIPREEEFKFKERSQILLDKWNKLMADETPPAPATAAVNGVNGGSAEKQAGDNAAKAGSEQSKSREPSHASAEKTKEPSKEPATEQVEQAAARDNSEKQKPSGEAAQTSTEAVETAA